MARQALAVAAPVVLNINFASPDLKIHIGSVMTVYISSVIPSQTMASVSVTVSNSTTITLGSSTLGAVPAQTLYVSDGTRAWAVPFGGGGATSLTFGDGNLLLNAPPFSGADYNSLALNAFQIYAGTLITGASSGSPQQNVEIASFDSTVTTDSGVSGDQVANDGVWSARYTVPDLGFIVANGKFFGITQVNSLLASNSPYQSVVSFALDGLRPNIDTINFKTNKSNYNGVMYLSKLSQGTTTPHPTNAQGRFDITVNKRGSEVNIDINVAPTTKSLQPILIPANATNLNGWKTWNGDDGSATPIFVNDGTYTASLYIKDEHGVAGLTKTVQIKVVSLRLEIKNIILTPAALNTLPPIVDGVLTVISHEAHLANDTNSDLTSSLFVLGWDSGVAFNRHSVVRGDESMVYTVNERTFLAPDGSVGIDVGNKHDFAAASDSDRFFTGYFRQAYGSGFFVPDCYEGLFVPMPNVTNNTFQTVHTGDNSVNNDWDSPVFDYLSVAASVSATIPSSSGHPLQPPFLMPVTIFAATDPTLMKQQYSIYVRGNTPPPGSYRLVVRSVLSGLEAAVISAPVQPNQEDPCFPGSTPVYRAGRVHFYPSVRPEGSDPTTYRGYGILAEDSAIIFSVNSNQAPTSDTTAPLFVSSDPQPDSLVPPNTYGPLKPLTASIQDIETPINVSPAYTFIRLTDPIGSIVGGNSATNGGGSNNSANVSFTPFSPLVIGGIYTMTLYACNQGGLCIQKDIKFEVQDQTAPDVSGVEIVSTAATSNIPLTMFQSGPDGPFTNISQVWATISMPSTSLNTIDWDQTTIALQRISGTSSINVPISRLTPIGSIPPDGKIRYRIDSPITDAGTFEVTVQTTSKDASGVAFSGPPASFVKPRFITIVNINTLSIRYLGSPIFTEAVSGTQPITATVGASTFNPLSANTQAFVPNYALLPANTGFNAITSSGALSHGLQLNFGAGSVTLPITWAFTVSQPLRFFVSLGSTDAPAGVSIAADVKLFGFNGITWVQQSVNPTLSGGNYIWTIDVVAGTPIPSVYGLFYPTVQPNISPTMTPTAVPFSHTRSFNPSHANASYRRARIYYSDMAPKEVEVKIYDTSGALVRSLALGAGVNALDVQVDTFYLRSNYFFLWDGANDTGNIVKNGIYLVRYRVTKMDNSTDSQVRLVALVR